MRKLIQPHDKHKSGIGTFVWPLVIGMLVTALLVTAKLYLEGTQLGHRVELLTYELLHGQVPAFSPDIEMPVVVLDIGQIPGGKGGQVTSRPVLKEILDELINQKPRGIAVDIDFSPSSRGWMDNDDPTFFEFCLEQRKRGVPIFLGVFRTASQKPEAWLGDPEFKALAADMTINGADTSKMRLWHQNADQELLYSISGALITQERLPLKPPAKLLRFGLQDRVQVSIDPNQPLLKSGDVRVNYSKLEAIQSQSLSAVSRQSIKDLGQKFFNKFVIVGDATDATDAFVVPGRVTPIPGVYLHACNLYSLTVEPFFELKHSVRLGIDFFAALIILLAVTLIRWKRRNQSFDWHRTQRKIIWFAVLATIIIGIVAVKLLDILWLDFFLVIFVLLLHPSVETWLGGLLRRGAHSA